MKKMTKTLIITFSLYLLTLAGCGMVDLAQLPHTDAENWRTFDPNDYGIRRIDKSGGTISYTWDHDAEFGETECVLPYWQPAGRMIDMQSVKGRLNGKAYPVIFDTGCNPVIILSKKIVSENDLPVYSLNPDDIQNSTALVIADSLEIGSFKLTDYPCVLWRHRAEFRFLGLPIHKPELIAIPLDMMSRFNYFKFDNLNKELSFSKVFAFLPDDASGWISIPFRIEGLFLLLEVPIENRNTTLRLDTGAGYELQLDESVVKELFNVRPDFQKARKRTTYLYGPYEDGKTAEKTFTAKNLHFGDRTMNRVRLIYSERIDDEGYEGTIGYEFFDDTVMVLDFEKRLLWIKKEMGSFFEEGA